MIYLDNAATSRFKPQSMIEDMNNTLLNSSNFSRATHSDALDTMTKITLFREKLKLDLNVAFSHETIFTASCTDALNMAILGFGLKEKKPFHIISTAFDHNATLRPIEYLRKIKKAYYTIIYPNNNLQIDIDLIKKSITPNTKLIVVNHMSNVTGSKINLYKLKDLASNYSIPIILDTAQSFGHIELDANGIAALAIAPHKGTHGPQGVGTLLINKSFELEPIKFGGSGIYSESLDQPNIYPDGYEVGTINAPGIIGFASSYKFTQENFKQINEHISKITEYAHERLNQLKNVTLYCVNDSPVISIKYKNYSSSKLADYLNQNNIAVRAGLHCAPLIHSHLGTIKCGLTRISIGYNNSFEDIDYLIELLSRLDNIN